MDSKEEISNKLFDIGAVKFGKFTLKSGLLSPIYVDLRILVSYPEALRMVAKELASMSKGLKYDRIAGIPYAAIPIATAVSLETGQPMLYPRKEQKEYGTKKAIEGVFEEGETVLVYDDLITKGTSKFEAIEPLEEAGLKVKDITVLIDREQGGPEELAEKGYELHSVLKISELLEALVKSGKMKQEQHESIKEYFADPEAWSKKMESEQ